jgi:hypothetical protein
MLQVHEYLQPSRKMTGFGISSGAATHYKSVNDYAIASTKKTPMPPL